jgi:carbon storage regulator
MLVLTRKAGEKIVIAENVVIEVLEIQGNRVRIGIQAPRGITILRQELLLEKSDDLLASEQPTAQLAIVS